MHKLPFARTILVLTLSLAAASAQAVEPNSASPTGLATMPLDQLLDMQVTGASKFSTTVAETAAAVTIVTRAEIRAIGYRTLAEVLATVKGVVINNDRTYSLIGVRGFWTPGDYNTRILTLVDGNRVNDAMYSQSYIGTEFPLDIEDVERVEFIPGQASAVYGTNALFGVVNVVTRKASQEAAPVVTMSMGTFGARDFRASSTVAVGEALVKWSASTATVRGEDVPANATVVKHGDFMHRNSIALDARLDDLSFTAIYASREKGVTSMLDVIPGDTRTRYIDTEALYNLAWNHTNNEGDDFQVRLFAGTYRFIGRYSFQPAPDVVNQDLSRARWWGSEARVSTERIAGHKLMLGGEFQLTPVLTHLNQDISPVSEPYLRLSNTARRAALFVEDQMRLNDTLTLDTSLRADRMRGYRGQTSERIAVMWRPSERWVAKAIYATAYREPNDFETNYEIPGPSGVVRNPNLTSERVKGIEFNLEWSPTSQDSFSASVFRNQARQLVVSEYDDSTKLSQFVNQGHVVARGFEAEWNHHGENGATWRMNISHSKADDRHSSVPVAIYAPRLLANAVLSVPLQHGMTVGAWWRGVSARGAASGYGLAGITLSSQEQPHSWTWSVRVSNLFNRAYQDPGVDLTAQPVISQAGRSVEVRIGRGF
jgi:outer membrane cobalamin receptor